MEYRHNFKAALEELSECVRVDVDSEYVDKDYAAYWVDDNIEATQAALRIADRLQSGEVGILQRFIDECESEMFNADHRKKVSEMDYHTSEICHQEGRWHCANDLCKWAEEMIKEIENEG